MYSETYLERLPPSKCIKNWSVKTGFLSLGVILQTNIREVFTVGGLPKEGVHCIYCEYNHYKCMYSKYAAKMSGIPMSNVPGKTSSYLRSTFRAICILL